jgi:hypothetical protein
MFSAGPKIGCRHGQRVGQVDGGLSAKPVRWKDQLRPVAFPGLVLQDVTQALSSRASKYKRLLYQNRGTVSGLESP